MGGIVDLPVYHHSELLEYDKKINDEHSCSKDVIHILSFTVAKELYGLL